MFKIKYIKKEFKKNKKLPLSKREYQILHEDFEMFLDISLEKRDKQMQSLLAEVYNFKKEISFITIAFIVTLFAYLIQRIYGAAALYIFYLILAIDIFILLSVIKKGISYLKSFISLSKEKKRFKNYYSYHYKIIFGTTSYQSYLERLKMKS
ncbi:hypothetical protein [Tenacibaculum agarivorans]|uniref:hypothetical protein n=1 Tax=Tenacibaculum agarivorans TaxID=1908389 RepID=UPI00094B8A7F|nr:hypothetical protein [Tenacibaculum agarivorans]